MTAGSREITNLPEPSKLIAPNDWRIGTCLVLCGSLLLATLGLIGLGALGLDIPVLRQIVAFIFLSLIPGLLILRILRIHNVHIIESLLYSVGLSLIFNMVTGVIANFALPLFGIKHPFTLGPLTVIFTIFLLILLFTAYLRDRNFQPVSTDKATETSIKASLWTRLNPYLLALLLPSLVILGVSLMNAYQSNIVLIVFIFTVALIIGLVAFNKFIPSSAYPFMIFMMAISLIYQTTLISSNLVGSDIHLEYYAGKLVLENGYWDAATPFTINSCLSIVMVAPVYSFFLGMDIVWLFKLVYPVFFALLPLALFRAFRLQFSPRFAFLTTLFFITLPMFTMDMAQLSRQQVSELFFCLAILLMVDRKLTLVKRAILIVIFGLGVIVSYYGLGTGYVGYLIFGALVLVIIKSRPGRFIWQRLIGKYNSLPPDLTSPGAFNKRALVAVVAISIVFMLAYYQIVASGTAMSGTRVVSDIASGIASGTAPGTASGIAPGTAPGTVPGALWWLDPFTKEPLTQTGLGLDFAWASILGKIWRIFQYLVELCLIVGFFRLIFRPATLGPKLKAEYISLTIVSAIILLGVFIFPTKSYGMGTSRIWQITLLLMSPLFIFGGEAIASGIARLVGVFRKGFASFRSRYDSQALLCFPVLLIMIPYFIFNSGIVFEISRSQTTHFIDMPYSIALSNYRTDVSTAFTKQDVSATDWLMTVAGEDYPAYADHHGFKLLGLQRGLFFTQRANIFLRCTKEEELSSPCYIYFRTWNVQKKSLAFGTVYAGRQSLDFDDLPWLMQALEKSGAIYNNGSARVLLCR
jgi:uncharacterized membrane protein